MTGREGEVPETRIGLSPRSCFHSLELICNKPKLIPVANQKNIAAGHFYKDTGFEGFMSPEYKAVGKRGEGNTRLRGQCPPVMLGVEAPVLSHTCRCLWPVELPPLAPGPTCCCPLMQKTQKALPRTSPWPRVSLLTPTLLSQDIVPSTERILECSGF